MKAPNFFEFFSQAKIISGKKGMENIPLEFAGMGVHRPMIVTSRSVVDSGLLQKLIKAFYESTLTIGAVFDGATSTVSASLIEKGAALFRWKECDSIIALGSGSIMDLARGINMAVTEKASLASLAGEDRVAGNLRPFAAVVTASLSGYEAGNKALIDNRVYKSDFLFPDIICIDNRMMLKQAPGDAVNSAMAALTHAIEACQEPVNNPMTDAYALAAIRYISDHLPVVVKKPRNNKALMALANASVAANIAYANAPAGIVHNLARALALETGHNEGMLMGLLLSASLEYKLAKKENIRQDLLMALIGFDESCRVSDADKAEKSIQKIRALQKACAKAMPRGLKELNIPAYRMEKAAGDAAITAGGKVKAQDCMAIMNKAL
ncbi:MAG: hypothetical protein CVV44_06255 [Spirochaetae bacterium HGW-Spirochaetae-1]|jgi:alcohol dehydrogenase|nr:MAG: hypothetical protein CVV44_06255 [Spirochaetae bacterium HGW-Spirochaetae-1]